MEKESLIKLRTKLELLSKEDKVKRNKYLRKLANGELQGPPVGHSSIDKSWLKYYSDDELDYEVPKMTISAFMDEQTKDYDDLVAFSYFNVDITFREYREKVEELKKSLNEIGVKQGDTVSVCLANMPEVAYVFKALNELGVVINMLDPRTNKSTQEENVNKSKSDVVIALDMVAENFIGSDAKKIITVSSLNSLPKFMQNIIKIMDKSMRVKVPEDDRIMDYNDFIKLGEGKPNVPAAPYIEGAPAVIAWTGGTTGKPKGVAMTNEAFNAMIVENMAVHYNAQPGDTALGMAPPWTFYGLSNSFNAYLCMGIKISLVPKFGPDDLGKLVLKYKNNHIVAVPSSLIGLMKENKIKKKDLSYIKTVIVGADKLTEKAEEEFNNFMEAHNSKTKVTKGYGMTEVCAAAAYTIGDTNTPGTVGIPLLMEDIAVFDPDDPDRELTTGERGEICIKGPKNMIGYFGEASDQTGQVLKEHADGSVWAHTGDIGHMDQDGKLYVDGRIKRMFAKMGFKIFPGEIENQILKHPDIEQASVVGIEDDFNGYIIAAYIVPKKDCMKDENQLISEVNDMLKASIYDYEVPDSINVTDSLPLTQMNKVDYRKLQEIYKEKEAEKNTGKVK